MSNQHRTITVKAKPHPTKPKECEFEMVDDQGNVTDTLVFDKKQEMKKSEHHTVVFKLKNEAGASLRFPDDKLRAMWVAKGNATSKPNCPKQAKHHAHIVADQVLHDELTVHNFNPEISFYKFVLNFVEVSDTSQVKLIPLDPVYENRNGGTK
ncbi:MAG: hypothetical protein ABIP91_00475 [Sphingomicrobium sp.]